MPVGDCEKAFLDAAAHEGIELVRYKQPWLNQRGHFGVPDIAAAAIIPLDKIFHDLGGDSEAQSAKRATALPGDFIHPPTGTMIEVDEIQHFTTFRMQTFAHYPQDTSLGFDSEEYLELCTMFRRKADTYRLNKAASAFVPGGRQRQRAYNDALRDLVIPSMGMPPLVRVPAPDGNGAAAFERNLVRILSALS
ncbi:hypothetical protein SAMN04487914_11840 [Arthrobacter sp. ok909]|uniref:DUF7255 family protein n=1 Tax=Arthrobacter sp. ok909 TaxID=1761746 RepID=UPI00088DD4CF|nr:hypothetical protein [Arthrobacter sp. ok909]SDP58131.1 hypothetical protein SAMN04487914_11840 [Arthrobacter sp. ok909]